MRSFLLDALEKRRCPIWRRLFYYFSHLAASAASASILTILVRRLVASFNRPGAQQAVCSSPNVSPSTPFSSSCLWFSGSGCRESLELSCRSQCSRCPKLFAIECAPSRPSDIFWKVERLGEAVRACFPSAPQLVRVEFLSLAKMPRFGGHS